jgi:hypothetical protein
MYDELLDGLGSLGLLVFKRGERRRQGGWLRINLDVV